MEAKICNNFAQEENISTKELEQIIFKEKPLSLLFIDDVISEDETFFSENTIDTLIPQSIEDIEKYYAATASDETTRHEGSSFSKTIRIHYPLHLAARDGDCEEIEALVNDGFGYDINAKDARSVTPLHVAALFGQNEAVKTLINLNAKVDAKGYEDHTPFQFALYKQHVDVANTLFTQGKADPLIEDYKGMTGLTMLMDTLSELLNDACEDKEAQAKLVDTFALVNAIIASPSGPLLYNDIMEFQDEIYLVSLPLPILLQFITSFAPTKAYVNQLIDLTEQAENLDSSYSAFIKAKDLLHRFPTGGLYQVDYTKDKSIWFTAEGHSGISTTALATESLQAFMSSPDFDKESELKTEIFNTLTEIYDYAKNFTLKSSMQETAKKALELYHEGKTVLLPSGWDGHFIDVILSKSQLMYVVANSGDRYHGESPDYNPDPAGINFYRIYEPDSINAQFMYNILNNSQKYVLEFENAYEYGVFERIDEISREDQQYGNCGWESHRDAVEGLIYIELLNRQVPSLEAKSIAAEFYQEWDDFHGNFVIDRFISDNPILPIEALFEIFNEIHLKDDYTAVDHIHAQKIADAMVSDHYVSQFKDWLKESGDHELSDKLMLNILKMEHGIDPKQIIAGNFGDNSLDLDPEDNLVSEDDSTELVAQTPQVNETQSEPTLMKFEPNPILEQPIIQEIYC